MREPEFMPGYTLAQKERDYQIGPCISYVPNAPAVENKLAEVAPADKVVYPTDTVHPAEEKQYELVPITTPPSKPGVQRLVRPDWDNAGKPVYSFWDGINWRSISSNMEGAKASHCKSYSVYQYYTHWYREKQEPSTEWRSISVPPKTEGVYELMHADGRLTKRYSMFKSGEWKSICREMVDTSNTSDVSFWVTTGKFKSYRVIPHSDRQCVSVLYGEG